MEFHVRTTSQPDLQSIQQRLHEMDPAGLVDHDGHDMLRISTVLRQDELVSVLGDAGQPVTLAAIEQQPSVCCGGCSG